MADEFEFGKLPERQLKGLSFVMHIAGVRADDECEFVLTSTGVLVLQAPGLISAINANGDLLDIDELERGRDTVRTRYEDYAPRIGQQAAVVEVDEQGNTSLRRITQEPGE